MSKWGNQTFDPTRQKSNRQLRLSDIAADVRRRKITSNVIYFIVIVFLAVGAFTLYNSLKNDDTEIRRAIQTCINNGGDPEYTTDKNGIVTEFLGCKMP